MSEPVFPSPDAAPFWEACRRRELVLPYCDACAAFFFYPRALCPSCGSRSVSWREVSGRGRLHAFCIHHVGPLAGAVTIIVELDEGPRMMSFLEEVEPDPALLQCEMPLRVSFREIADGQLLPVFVPAVSQNVQAIRSSEM